LPKAPNAGCCCCCCCGDVAPNEPKPEGAGVLTPPNELKPVAGAGVAGAPKPADGVPPGAGEPNEKDTLMEIVKFLIPFWFEIATHTTRTKMFLMAMVAISSVLLLPSSAFLSHHPIAIRGGSKLPMGFIEDAAKKAKQALVEKLAGPYDVVKVSEELNSYIKKSDDQLLMLTFANCPYCVQARELLDSKGTLYTDVIIDDLESKGGLRCELGKKFGQTSVPAIFLKQNFLGGMNNGGMGGLKTLNDSGQLDIMLQ